MRYGSGVRRRSSPASGVGIWQSMTTSSEHLRLVYGPRYPRPQSLHLFLRLVHHRLRRPRRLRQLRRFRPSPSISLLSSSPFFGSSLCLSNLLFLSLQLLVSLFPLSRSQALLFTVSHTLLSSCKRGPRREGAKTLLDTERPRASRRLEKQ